MDELKIDLPRALRDDDYRKEISEELEGYGVNDLRNDAADEIDRLSSTLKVKPLDFKDESGVSGFGQKYTAFGADTLVGRVCYGQDTDGIYWYSYPKMGKCVTSTSASSLNAAKKIAVEGYKRAVLSHPILSALD